MKNKKSRNTQGMRQWKKFKRNKMAVIALIVLGILIFASAFAPLLTSYDPEAISLTERTLAARPTCLAQTRSAAMFSHVFCMAAGSPF